MKIIFAVTVFLAFGAVYILFSRKRNTSGTDAETAQMQHFIFGAEHEAILSQFKIHKGESLSADRLQNLTNIEPVRVNAILTDLVGHDLLIQSNTDKIRGNWLYIPSKKGKKYIHKHV